MPLFNALRIQPIVNTFTGDIYGYELLSRPLYNKSQLNGFKGNTNLGFINMVSAIKTLLGGASFNRNNRLFVNFSEKEPLNKKELTQLSALLEQLNFSKKNLFLEISEESTLRCMSSTYELWNLLKTNFTIVLDDFGLNGMMPVDTVKRFNFNIVKLDKSLLRVYDDYEKTLECVGKYVDALHDEKIQTLIEGIETEKDLKIARKLKVVMTQGYFFGKPYEVWKGSM